MALTKTPFDLVRGTGGEEKVLKNAKDSCAAEALEVATYTALARLARTTGDGETERLAKSIMGDEQKMLDRLLKEIPRLTDAVARAEFDGQGSYDVTDTGAADAVREAGGAAKRTARKSAGQAKRTARQARKVPGVARAEGTVKGAAASESDLAISNYHSLSADEVQDKLAELSQIELAKVNAYERKNQNRSTVTSRIDSLQGDEPWPGYDELAVEEVRAVLSEGRRHPHQGCPQLRAQAQEPRRRAPSHRARAQQRLRTVRAKGRGPPAGPLPVLRRAGAEPRSPIARIRGARSHRAKHPVETAPFTRSERAASRNSLTQGDSGWSARRGAARFDLAALPGDRASPGEGIARTFRASYGFLGRVAPKRNVGMTTRGKLELAGDAVELQKVDGSHGAARPLRASCSPSRPSPP